MEIVTQNPATEETIKIYEYAHAEQIETVLSEANTAFQTWSKSSFAERAKVLLEIAAQLLEHKEIYAKLMTTEMGKPIRQALSEIEKCAWVCQHYAKCGEEYLADRQVHTEFYKSFVTYQPLGVIFGIMPWNFPFWQVFRFAAPTIMAGNTIILKHAPNTTGAGFAIAELFEKASASKGLFHALVLSNEQAASIIQHPTIAGVTLTGSIRAGRSVAKAAGQVVKKVVLELGGSDPYLILKDADLELAADCCVRSRMNNAGQVCISAKRIIVAKEIYPAFKELIQEKMQTYRMGDPLDPSTNLGPMARQDLRESVHQQVLKSVEKGAHLMMGGKMPEEKGFYYPPTILENIKPGLPAYDEEIFGPVASLFCAESEEEAIRIANDTFYGLAAAIFSKNVKRAEEIAVNHIQAGICAVNSITSSDPRLPFGGVKNSGIGRELSEEGARTFTNVKTVTVNI